MSFTPHTEMDIQHMLKALGVEHVHDLFSEIPAHLKTQGLKNTPDPMNEMDVVRHMRERAELDKSLLCFAGAGAYEHHIPSAIWDIAARGEFMTAYTPYQAEASQGTLQVIYEYQTMMAHLTGMDVANASMYDGASSFAEAVLMSVRCQKKSASRTIIVPKTLNPRYREVASSLCEVQDVHLKEINYDDATGCTDLAALKAALAEKPVALAIPMPNYFGHLEDVHTLTRMAHEAGVMVIAVVNPTALALLASPGEWGDKGADIVCGEAQPLGIPLSSGGPYVGFMACQMPYVRQMPGRIIGRTHDAQGRVGYSLTLQAREQHIRRAKATSNICTNQGLMVVAATAYMSLLGEEGLRRVAKASHANLKTTLKLCEESAGVTQAFQSSYFHETVLRLPTRAETALTALLEAGILGGVNCAQDYPELGDAILVCTTETRTQADLERYAQALGAACLAKARSTPAVVTA